MTTRCEHMTTVELKKENNLFKLCLSCGKLMIFDENQEVYSTNLYKTDELREFLIDKLAEWWGKDQLR